MAKAVVVGWPVSHSLSPKLHNYWLKKYGISGDYSALAVKPEELEKTLRNLPAQGFAGVNLTIPHKEAVLPLLDEIDAKALEIGAVNTIVIEGEKFKGTNTDAYGFWENIRLSVGKKNKAVVLGAGGAARAICWSLKEQGFQQIILINRTHEKAQILAEEFGSAFRASRWESREKALAEADVLINTTSLGLAGKERLEIDLFALPKTALVTDSVYTPLMTPLLLSAKARGNPIVDGLGMLIHQAVPAFEAWFGVRPEVTPELKPLLLGTS